MRLWRWMLFSSLLLLPAMTATATAQETLPTTTITFSGVRYNPRSVTIAPGQAVEWFGAFETHPLVSNESLWPMRSTGSSFRHVFTKPGTYLFYCELHGDRDGGGMAGTVVVKAPQCFDVPGVTHCVEGRFREFWEFNKGLQSFGYPLTSATAEINPDTGRTHLTQWLERNRFEHHPGNGAPYDVVLGRLGAELLARQGRDIERMPESTPPTNRCRMFDVGGQAQWVCDSFLQYWEANGLEFDGRAGKSYAESLALFGLPLTYPKMETNPNGDTIMTQWFERARFEDHGSSGVLLGLLGREILEGE